MNRQYNSNIFDSTYQSMARELVNGGEFQTLNKNGDKLSELINPTFTITNPRNCFALIRNMSIPYLQGELEFYLSGSPYLEDIEKYSKFWANVSDDGYTITSNYGRLLLHDRNSSNLTQFEYAKQCLLKNPDSKKAVMVIYNKEHARKTKDNPCTMYAQYFLRKGKLHILVKMRSSDIWFGLPYDVPFFVYLQLKMAKELGVEVGHYTHNSGSLHLYERNKVALSNFIEGKVSTFKKQEHMFQLIFKGEFDETVE